MSLDVFETCPILANENYLIRLIEGKDKEDLLKVYSDKLALPFFNSDNCHGSNFYISNLFDMENTILYWLKEYHENKGFIRLSIVDKKRLQVIGTIEVFKRVADDFFNHCVLLRVDVGSENENSSLLTEIFSLISDSFIDWFDVSFIAAKAPIYAVERIESLKKVGYTKSDQPLVGHMGIKYYGYWIKRKN